MQSIKLDNRNYPILNYKNEIMTDFQTQWKHATLCNIPAHMRIKGNEAAYETAKEAVEIPGMTTTRLPYKAYFPAIRRDKLRMVE